MFIVSTFMVPISRFAFNIRVLERNFSSVHQVEDKESEAAGSKMLIVTPPNELNTEAAIGNQLKRLITL